MAKTPSTMLALGTAAAPFRLPNSVDGKMVDLHDFDGTPGLLVMFICNHCPYVKHVQKELTVLAGELQRAGLSVVAISANDAANYPDDSPANMKLEAERAGYTFPYLHDETQSVARAYHAACTPEFYLFDAARKLIYRGRMDGSTPGNGVPITGDDLRAAASALLAGKAISDDQKPSVGCNIKWKR